MNINETHALCQQYRFTASNILRFSRMSLRNNRTYAKNSSEVLMMTKHSRALVFAVQLIFGRGTLIARTPAWMTAEGIMDYVKRRVEDEKSLPNPMV